MANKRPVFESTLRDESLIGEVLSIYEENYLDYGVYKMHAAMNRAGWETGRGQTISLVGKAILHGMTGEKGAFERRRSHRVM